MLIIVVAAFLLILLIPVGLDFCYKGKNLTLKAKIGLFRIPIVQSKSKTSSEEQTEEKKRLQKKTKKTNVCAITRQDIPALIKIFIRLLKRLRLLLSIDIFQLHLVAAADDPFDAVVQFGTLNAGLHSVMPLAKEVLKIREEDVCISIDFNNQKIEVMANVVATLQIWEIFLIVISTGWALGIWYFKKRKQVKAQDKLAKKKG